MLPRRESRHRLGGLVADDVGRAWKERGEHLLHDVRTYAACNPGDETTTGFTHVNTVEELCEAAASHVIISVPEAVSRARAGEVLNLSPLCAGLPPEIARTIATAPSWRPPGSVRPAR